MVKIQNFTTTQINILPYSSGRIVYDSTLKICNNFTDINVVDFLNTDENGTFSLSNNGSLHLLTINSTISSGNSNIQFNTNGNDWSLRSGGSTHSTIPNTFSIYDTTNSLYRLLIDNTGNIDIVNHNSSTTGLKLGGALITSSTTELNYLDLTTGAGTAQASKALVLNSSSNITGINSLSATTLSGTLSTASQLNITSVGTLTSLTLSGAISGITTLSASGIVSLTNATASTTTGTGALVITGSVGVGGTINATNIGGTISTGVQPNITSLGTLTSLTLAGPISGATTISASGIVSLTNATASTTTTTGALVVAGGLGVGGDIYATSIGGTLLIASQTNITSLGQLTSLRISGDVGINTTTPSRQLEINNVDGNCLRLTYNDSNGGAINYTDLLVSSVGDLTITNNTTITGTLSGITTLSTSGVATLSNNTTSTTTGTGALVITGGLGISGAINNGGVINSSGIMAITNATDSTTSTDGTLVVTGGLGISGQIHTNNLLEINGALSGVTTISASGIATLSNNTASTTTGTGALVITGGLGIGGDINSNDLLAMVGTISGITDFNASGIMTISNNTASTTTTNGALVITGGLGIGGEIRNGGIINSSGIVTIENATDATTTTTGALVVTGGVGISGEIHTNNSLAITGTLSGVTTLNTSDIATLSNATASTTTGTGALVITGGLGISGDINSNDLLAMVGTISGITDFNASGIMTISNNTASTTTTNGALVITGGLGVGGAIRNGGIINSSGIVTIENATDATTTTTGALVVTGGVGISGEIHTNGLLAIVGVLSGVSTLDASDIVTLSNATASTTTANGALVVTGGVGVGGNIRNNNIINSPSIMTIENATDSTTSTNGALIVNGGVGITGQIHTNNLLTITGALSGVTTISASGIATLTNNSATTSATTGALRITGGIGISGTITCGTRIGVRKNPAVEIDIKQNSNTTGGLTMVRSNNTNNWRESHNTSSRLLFSYNGASRGFLSSTGSTAQINFTGQHRNICTNGNIMSGNIADFVGRIVYATGSYYNLNGDAFTINEALPTVDLTNTTQDKRVFGVISNMEENTSERIYEFGAFASVFERIETDNRLIINAVGEGMVWVCNKNGNFTNGDYITTSTVVGYGQLQNDGFLHSYTVGKITQDCDFSIPERYVNSSGVVITQVEYDADTVNNFKCNFVGCTYHCG